LRDNATKDSESIRPPIAGSSPVGPDVEGSPARLEDVYIELRRRATQLLARERGPRSFGATDLVHEAYLSIASPGDDRWCDNVHYLNAAVSAMRRALVDKARARGRIKRGGGKRPIAIEAALGSVWTEDRLDEVLVVDEALRRLEHIDPRAARVVESRFFGGMNIQQTAESLGVSVSVVNEDWRFARAWLRREFAES